MNFQFTEATSHFCVLCGVPNAIVCARFACVCLGILSKMSAQMQTKQAQDYLKSRSTSMFSSTLMWEIPFMTFTIQITCDFCLEEFKMTVHQKIKSLANLANWRELFLLTLSTMENHKCKLFFKNPWCARMYNTRSSIYIRGVAVHVFVPNCHDLVHAFT